jgi:DNA-binding transcriptional LysR family regulator
MNVTLTQLRVFCEVARREHFSQAAEALYVSQPAVSKSVKDLERQVGLPLFEQIGRRTQLTEAGRVLMGHAERLLMELADADRAIQGMLGGEIGRLVVGASSTPGTYLLPLLLGEFRRRHPGVEVCLEVADTREVVQRVTGGQLDVGVVGEAPFDPSLRVERFRRDTLVLILSADHPLAARDPIDPANLADAPFIMREQGSSTRHVLERALRERGLEPRIVMELGSTEAIKKTVAAGLGISFVSRYAVELEERVGVLVSRPVPTLSLHRDLHVIRRATLPLTPLHRRFLEALQTSPTAP